MTTFSTTTTTDLTLSMTMSSVEETSPYRHLRDKTKNFFALTDSVTID